MKRWMLAAVAGLALGATAARAEPMVYSVTAMGTGVEGSSKCATYKITIDVTVDGKSVKGTFKQQGRPDRAFTATLDDKNAFTAKADVGEGNTMNVVGSISGDYGRIELRGYCIFAGRLDRTK